MHERPAGTRVPLQPSAEISNTAASGPPSTASPTASGWSPAFSTVTSRAAAVSPTVTAPKSTSAGSARTTEGPERGSR